MNEAQRLRDTIDLLERNARIQARLLADTARERDHALGLVESAVASFRAIQDATIKGKVCDDVAWFSDIETLHDYCADVADRLSHPSTVGEPK